MCYHFVFKVLVAYVNHDFKNVISSVWPKAAKHFAHSVLAAQSPVASRNLSPCTAAPCDCSGFLIKQQQYPAIFALCVPFCKPTLLPPPSSTTWFAVFLPSFQHSNRSGYQCTTRACTIIKTPVWPADVIPMTNHSEEKQHRTCGADYKWSADIGMLAMGLL